MNATVRGFIKKEMAQAVRDPRMRIMLFVMPVIQMTLFGLALSNEIKNVKLLVVGQPGDHMMWKVAEHCFASGWFVPVSVSNLDPFEVLQSGKADAVLIAPEEGLGSSVGRGAGRLQLLVDATNAVRARGVETYIQAILASMPELGARGPTGGFSIQTRVLYNPSMRTPVFLVPGVMCLILCLLTIVLTSMSIAREREAGTLETLIAAPVKKWEIILGKTIPYVILGLADVPLVLGVAVFLFKVPMKGSLLEIALASIVFVCTAVSTGTLISTFARNQQQAMMGGFLFMFPAIQLSGVMFPLDNIPAAIAWVPYLNPLRYFVVLLRNIMLKGGEPTVVWSNLAAMAALGAAMVFISFKRFHRTLN